MDLMELIVGIPAIIVTICAMIATALPAPTAPGAYAVAYAIVNAVAFNVGKARNREAP